MIKINTLFRKNPNDLGRVINEINPENQWVFDGEGVATQKFDGSASAIIDGSLYKRYDAKKGKNAPYGAIPCQEADVITGHHPHWVKCDRNKKEDKYFFEAFDILEDKLDATYELCGEKVQGNPEKIKGHVLLKHGSVKINLNDLSFEGIRDYLVNHDIEGIVFHHVTDNRMCKIRKTDFGDKR